jgi:hypothetical protein
MNYEVEWPWELFSKSGKPWTDFASFGGKALAPECTDLPPKSLEMTNFPHQTRTRDVHVDDCRNLAKQNPLLTSIRPRS